MNSAIWPVGTAVVPPRHAAEVERVAIVDFDDAGERNDTN
jgi:hypothetical protein